MRSLHAQNSIIIMCYYYTCYYYIKTIYERLRIEVSKDSTHVGQSQTSEQEDHHLGFTRAVFCHTPCHTDGTGVAGAPRHSSVA